MIRFLSRTVYFRIYLIAIIALYAAGSANSQTAETIKLWPQEVPGELDKKQAPEISDNTSGDVQRISKVTDPALIVYKPSLSNKNGAAVIVCPGGGYSILAVDLEGYEVAKWLSSLGYTAFVLQYRVPQKRLGALNDVQRAVRIVRSKAPEWNFNPEKIGVLGFSAGGSLSARVSTQFKTSSYVAQDKTDSLSSRPDFTVLIYPAYLDQGENRRITPELTIDDDTPPMFIFATADDYYGNSALVMAGALRDKKIPVELHFLSSGGHGYGLRKGNEAAETWPVLAEKWMGKLIE